MIRTILTGGLLTTALAAPTLGETISLDVIIGDSVEISAPEEGLAEGQRLHFDASFEQENNDIDILFLTDTTGSMGPFAAAAAREADDILDRTSGFGNVAWTVASYRDFPISPWGRPDDYPVRIEQSITQDQELVAAGIEQWDATGGSDGLASSLFALQSIAENAEEAYRPDSERYLLWFGDAPSNDPIRTPGYPGSTVDEAIDALQLAEIVVLGIDINNLNGFGQLFPVIDATGGSIGELEGRLSDLVFNSLFEVIDVRTELTLDLELLDEDGSSLFALDTMFEGLVRGDYTLDLDLADGSFALNPIELAFDPDEGIAPIPLPASLPLLGFAIAGLGFFGRRRSAPAAI